MINALKNLLVEGGLGALLTGLMVLLFSMTGTTLFPQADTGQAQVRLRLPVGPRLERTETDRHSGTDQPNNLLERLF